MMKHRTRWLAGFSAVLLTLTMAATAFAYNDTTPGSITVTAHGACSATFTLTAKVLDATGAPVVGQSVAWSFVTVQSTRDKINSTPTITNSHGVTTTTVTLASVRGVRRIRATAGKVSGSVVLNPSYEGCGGVLPSTSTLPADTAPGQVTPLLALLFALAFVTGGGLTLRRLASTRS